MSDARIDRTHIPVFISDFLQDFSAELRTRLPSIQHIGARLEFRADIAEYEGRELEHLDAICYIDTETYVQVVIFENRRANYVLHEPSEYKNGKDRYTASITTLKGSASEIAKLVRDSLQNEVGVREIWRNLDERQKK
jgi:hypothetical protein